MVPKLRACEFLREFQAVRERSVRSEAKGATHGGAFRSENAGISNNKGSENLPRRKSKVSWATRLDPGLVGPKARLKSVVDGQLVNIPALGVVCWFVRIAKSRTCSEYTRFAR